MATITDVKNELIEHLNGIDKRNLSVLDLKTYAEIVQIVDGMSKADAYQTALDLISKCGSFGYGKPAKMKEG